VLSPEHLRYLARQLRLFKVIKEESLVKDDKLDEAFTVESADPEAAENEEVSTESQEPASENDQEVLSVVESFVDSFLGDKLVKSLNEGGSIDVSDLTYPDQEIQA